MAATKLQLNVTNVAFGATPITKVTSFVPDPGGSLITFAGDDDRYPTVVANSMNTPRISITTGDVGTLAGIAVGSQGTITGTYKDALRQSGGDINWTIINCVYGNFTPSQSHGQFASATGHWESFSQDGQTSPISFTRS